MKRFLALAALAALFIVPKAPQPAASTLTEISFGCTVLLRSTGATLHSDATHHCDPRFLAATVDASGTLDITYEPIVKVVSFDLTADESITATTYGPSVGLEHSWFRFRNSAGTILDADGPGVACGACNIFIRVWGLVETTP